MLHKKSNAVILTWSARARLAAIFVRLVAVCWTDYVFQTLLLVTHVKRAVLHVH